MVRHSDALSRRTKSDRSSPEQRRGNFPPPARRNPSLERSPKGHRYSSFLRLWICTCGLVCHLTNASVVHSGVIRFVTFGGAITPVPSAQIDNLRMLLLQKMPCALHAFLKIGQQVRIRGGSLDGLEGILEQSGQKNLVISIESMQRSVAIKIEGYELELV